MKTAAEWIDRLADHPLLTREVEYELATRAVNGDVAARRELVRCNMRLVISYASMMSHKFGISIEDLISEGALAMYEDVFRKFDPERGNRFCTYAKYWIFNRLMRIAIDMHSNVEGNRAAKSIMSSLNKLRDELGQEGAELTEEELAERMGLTEAELKRARASRTSDLSIHNVLSSEDSTTTFADMMVAEDADETDQAELLARRTLITRIRQITDETTSFSDPRERYILEHRLMADEEETLAEIGKRFGVSRERIRQLEEKLRKRLETLLTECREP
jgi:RNA polymerase sigma-32 factor